MFNTLYDENSILPKNDFRGRNDFREKGLRTNTDQNVQGTEVLESTY